MVPIIRYSPIVCCILINEKCVMFSIIPVSMAVCTHLPDNQGMPGGQQHKEQYLNSIILIADNR